MNSTSVHLGRPREQGGVAIEYCIRHRRSVRGFGSKALAEDQLGQLLWAAQGITGTDGSGRAAPSAGALYPLELSVVCGNVRPLARGVYRYCPGPHELELVAAGYRHEALIRAAHQQEWVATAAAVICVAAVFERTTVKYDNRGIGYVYMEAGHAAENLMLQAVDLGLATTMVGSFDDEAVKRFFHLEANETPLCLLPVGIP